ncbi:hypothetical protein ACFOGJ_28725 [Marinibaculum pumilum]|uniref:N-acetyltransferase n=1 Tax=Marinibaculum pumilum TaxID=1766165 RepID=A0ABV7L9H5_9PROT
MLVFAQGEAENRGLAAWTAARIDHVDGFAPPCQCAAVTDAAGRVVAGIVFHDWQPAAGTLQLSMAAESPAWASRAVLAALFRYAFVTNGAAKLWTATPHRSERALRFNLGIGMRREAVLRHQFGPGRHAVICSMLAREWRRSRWNGRPPRRPARQASCTRGER